MRIDICLQSIRLVSVFAILLCLCACDSAEKKKPAKEPPTEQTTAKENRKLHYDEVYVCTGKYAKRFHCDEDCKGLQSCRSEIITMSIEEAEDYGLTPCGYCY